MNSARRDVERGSARAFALIVGTVCLLAFSSTFFVNGPNGNQGGNRQNPTVQGPGHEATGRNKYSRHVVRGILELMNERIALMHDVARWKYNNDVPIADLKREKEILDKLATQKRMALLGTDFMVAFFQAQMDAAKSVQTQLIQHWKKEKRKPFVNVPDLKTELRPQISKLGRHIDNVLWQMGGLRRPSLQIARMIEAESEAILSDELLTPAMRQDMIRPLVDLFSTPHPN